MSAEPEPPPASFDVYSVRSNPSASASASRSRSRSQAHREIAARFFGPASRATDAEEQETQEDGDDAAFVASARSDSALATRATSEPVARQASLPSERRPDESAEQRERRKSNCEIFEDLVHMANTQQPVHFDVFREGSARRRRKTSSLSVHALEQLSARRRQPSQVQEGGADRDTELDSDSDSNSGSDDEDDGDDEMDPKINIELLEAYIAYSKSIGREPNIQIGNYHSDSDDAEHSDRGGLTDPRMSYVQRQPVVEDHKHFWTGAIGTRHSKRRGCVQFWIWMLIGVAVVVILGISLSNLQLNEVLHLDAFVENNVVVTQDFTYLYIQDEVNFHLKYELEPGSAGSNDTHFMVLLMYDDDFEKYVEGENFSYIEEGSILRTTYASFPLQYIDSVKDEMYLVFQPCVLAWNPTADYCQTTRLPTPVHSKEKVYNLGQKKFMSKQEETNYFPIRYIYVNPIPDRCAASGFQGTTYLLLFVPYVLILAFGLRLFQMMFHCESFRASLERAYKKEFDVPENEVDYWQPVPWDRKVPKTRLLGPCCWRKFRRPFEPFYTWWRHENYFTWVFCPYRNERLSRSERAIIVACSLYITFYVLFIIVMMRDSLGANISLFSSVVLYAILISVLPSAGKAIFKELFKLIFRQRRKYFRAKAAGGDVSQFSFRLAFLLQIFVAILITICQLPIFYIWVRRSCLFLSKFMYFAVLAAVMRLSIMGLVQDFAWYIILKTWGWKDLCPYCTERIVHCDCFNDELLVLAVERVGPKWELIAVLDKLLAKSKGYEPQFALYTTDQLRERWAVIVDRAETHMEKLEKLRAYREKKRLERLRRQRQQRLSFAAVSTLFSFRDGHKPHDPTSGAREMHTQSSADDDEMHETDSNSNRSTDEDELDALCSLREKKIIAVNAQVHLEKFEKHYDSTIVDVFRSLGHAVTRHRPHRHHRREDDSGTGGDITLAEDHARIRRSDRQDSSRTPTGQQEDADDAEQGESPEGSSEGETMWVFDTPAERLERREREKLLRKQAFRVLKDYEIEAVEVEQDPQGNVRYIPPLSSDTPASSRDGPSSAPSTPGRGLLARFDSMHRPLLPRQRSEPTEDDIVVVPSSMTDLAITVLDDEYDGESSADEGRVSAGISRDSRSERKQSASSMVPPLSSTSASAVTSHAAPPSSRTYSVVPRRQTLLRRVSATATAFASWALKYDNDTTATPPFEGHQHTQPPQRDRDE